VTTRFEGFPPEAFDFYARLSSNNTKPWWNEHRDEYERFVRAPLVALTDELEPEFGPAKLFRPYNDQRFRTGAPIKTHQGATVMLEDAVGLYVQVSAEGLMVAGGWYAPGGDQLRRYREAVDSAAGATLERLVGGLGRVWELDGDPVATRPRGYDADHPRIELLRMRRLTVARRHGAEPWVGQRAALTRVRRDWRGILPLLEWLADHVGPIEDPGR